MIQIPNKCRHQNFEQKFETSEHLEETQKKNDLNSNFCQRALIEKLVVFLYIQLANEPDFVHRKKK